MLNTIIYYSLLKLIEINQNNHFKEAMYLFNAKFYKESIKYFPDKSSKFIKAIAYFRAKNYEKALKELENINIEKFYFLKDKIYYYKANTYYKLKNYKKALKELKKISPDFVLSDSKDRLNIEILLKLDRIKEIKKLYDKHKNTKITKSDSMKLMLNLAKYIILSSDKKNYNLNIKKAQNIIKNIISNNPNLELRLEINILKEKYKLNLDLSNKQKANSCILMSKYHQNKEANKCFNEFINKLNYKKDKLAFCDSYFYQAYSYRKRRIHKKAVNNFNTVINNCKNYKNNDRAYYIAGISSLYQKKHKDAIKYFEKLYKKYPKSSLADDGINYIGFIYSKLKNYKKAQKIYNKQIKLFPNGDTTKNAIWKIAYNYYKEKKYKDYLKFYNQIKKTSFKESHYYSRGRLDYFKARILELTNKKSQAQKVYKALILKYKNNYYSYLAKIRFKGEMLNKRKDDSIKYDNFISFLKEKNIYKEINFYASNKLIELLTYELNNLNEKFNIFKNFRKEIFFFLIDNKIFHLAFWKKDLNFKWDSYNLIFEENINYLKYLYPLAYNSYVSKFAKKEKINKFLILSIMREESYFHPSIESWANAYGLMQLIEPTAKDISRRLKIDFKREKLFIPQFNIRLGSKYLSWASNVFNKKLYYIIPSYNAGVNAVKRFKKNFEKKYNKNSENYFDEFIEDIPYEETRKYTKRVLNTYFLYNRLYNQIFLNLNL